MRCAGASGEKAGIRFREFFAARIRNPNTRRAYGRAVAEFLAGCEDNQASSIVPVQPLHVAAWVELQQREHAAPTIKQRLAALPICWTAGDTAYSVRGTSHTVKDGKTPVLPAEEARALLDSTEVTTIVARRDRALIRMMVFSFARIGAVLGMKVEDVNAQNRLLERLREKAARRTPRRALRPASAPTSSMPWVVAFMGAHESTSGPTRLARFS
jgi:integrase